MRVVESVLLMVALMAVVVWLVGRRHTLDSVGRKTPAPAPGSDRDAAGFDALSIASSPAAADAADAGCNAVSDGGGCDGGGSD